MDCSVISQDLCNKVERIYTDFGKYLHRYVCSSAQILIDKFKNAIQVCFFKRLTILKRENLKVFHQKPSNVEDFAKYASCLAPHKAELSSNQHTIEYLTSLFEVNFHS